MIGCGGITRAHLPAFLRHPDKLQLVAATDPFEPSRAAVVDAVKSLGPVRQFSDVDEGFDKMAGEFDAVLVLTPHHLHFPAAMKAVQAGKPVLVEKPIVNTLQEACQLYEAAEKAGVTVMAGQTRRFMKGSIALKNWVKAKPENFGALRTFEMSAWQSIEAWIANKPDKNADFWITDKKRAGGGVVVSLMVHYLDLIRFLFDTDYQSVVANGRFDPPFRNGAESSCCALLTTTSGASGTLHANYLARKNPYCETFKAIGEYGVLGNHPAIGDYQGPEFLGSTEGLPIEDWTGQHAGVEPLDLEKAGLERTLEDQPFVNQLLEFHAAVTQKREPESSLRINLNTLATIDAIYESLQNDGARVEVKNIA
jgi:predicted dehydrogenase